ncbi:LPS-assembly protein LptD [Aquabacterium sp. UBA2148]|uniref:LPS-assembly protein LptD n=1 Tax=Aquabacterium sp. UBA2148 TaxID=1946042 RepID=UPI002579FA21|nr:LPS assembly protein LptD [Aquabacterium sp. UBA2148]
MNRRPTPQHRPIRRRTAATTPIWRPVALAAACLAGPLHAPSQAQVSEPAPITSSPASQLPQAPNAVPSADPASRMSFSLPSPRLQRRDAKEPLFFEADQLGGEASILTRATGSVRLRQGDLAMRADEITHTQADNTAKAQGKVRIVSKGNLFTGPELTLRLDTLEGNFVRPEFWLARTQAGGDALLVEFLGEDRLRAHQTSYSSCRPEDMPDGSPGKPDWELHTSEVYLDFAASEGTAKNAVIRFMDVPILAAPTLTFPLDNQRKSGLLPPSFYFDSNSGFEFSTPYYWNIAPEQDATIAPTLSARRGVGLDLEYRYLTTTDTGKVHLYGLPNDRLTGDGRSLVDFTHKGRFRTGSTLAQNQYDIKWLRASDDDYWKDFSHNLPSPTPRLFDSHVKFDSTLNDRTWGLGNSQTNFYAAVQSWQTLRDLDPDSDPELSRIEAPYRREPQLGFRSRSSSDAGTVFNLQGEFNRFAHTDITKVTGNRVNLNGRLERRFDLLGISVLPAVAVRGISYDLDRNNALAASGSRASTSIAVPTFSLDSGFSMERDTQLFGRDLVQTLEPRVMYVYTPYRRQDDLPKFDSAPRDFNQYAVFNDNGFTGGDRITDANQVTVGVTSRLIDSATGVEALRLGIAQKVLLADQRINPQGEGPITQKLSDLLLLASTSVIPNWNLDSTLQYGAQEKRTEQGTVGVRYSPGAWRTVSATYRYTREASEQVELGWQWPLAGRTPPLQQMMTQASSPDLMQVNPRRAGTNACGGAWYSVGRVTHSMRDKRVINSLIGLEYDAGCWIGRVVAERVALGQSKANTRIMFQLELLGLSQLALGANPLRVLQQNVPGYRLLREEGQPLNVPSTPTSSQDE